MNMKVFREEQIENILKILNEQLQDPANKIIKQYIEGQIFAYESMLNKNSMTMQRYNEIMK